MEVNVHHAKTHLSKLIAAAESGEEVIIARAGKPAVKLVLVTPPARRPRKELLGSLAGVLPVYTNEEWAALDKEIANDFENSIIVPEADHS